MGFQSLGRDSVCSSFLPIFQPAFPHPQVSIPRSGFCLFKQTVALVWPFHHTCFNPSVGILFVQARPCVQPGRPGVAFQSLGRDSVCSSGVEGCASRGGRSVSIPRSGFCLFKRFGGLVFGLAMTCFNPSVGILFVQAARMIEPRLSHPSFQSLGRDSVCSSPLDFSPVHRFDPVSIPRSGFCLFKPSEQGRRKGKANEFQSLGRDSVCSSRKDREYAKRLMKVSIPRSGFCLFKRGRI